MYERILRAEINYTHIRMGKTRKRHVEKTHVKHIYAATSESMLKVTRLHWLHSIARRSCRPVVLALPQWQR